MKYHLKRVDGPPITSCGLHIDASKLQSRLDGKRTGPPIKEDDRCQECNDGSLIVLGDELLLLGTEHEAALKAVEKARAEAEADHDRLCDALDSILDVKEGQETIISAAERVVRERNTALLALKVAETARDELLDAHDDLLKVIRSK